MAIQMQQIARGWLVYELTSSPLALGLVMLSFASPMAIFALFGGALADRVPKVRLIITIQATSVILAIILAALIHTQLIAFWHLLVFGVVNGSFMALQMPSRLTIVTEIVAEDKVMNAIALNTSGSNLSRIVGPGVAGILIAAFGTATVFYLIAGLYVFSILCTSRIKLKRPAIRKSASMGREIAEGIRYASSNNILRSLIIVGFVSMLIGMMSFQSLMPAWSVEALGLGAEGLGLLMATMGVGAVFGALFVASLSGYRRRGMLILVTSLIWAALILVFSQSNNLPFALVLLAAVGFLSATFLSLNQSLTQILASPEMRGRVMSINAMSWGIMPIGALAIGALAEQIGTPDAIAISAILLIVFTLVYALLNPKFRSWA